MDHLDLVVFDMAGTTIQAADQVPAAFQQAFEQCGVKLSEEEIRSVRGRSKGEAIADLLTRHLGSADGRQLATEACSRFQRILMERYERQGVEPVDGAGETFEWVYDFAASPDGLTAYSALAEQYSQSSSLRTLSMRFRDTPAKFQSRRSPVSIAWPRCRWSPLH